MQQTNLDNETGMRISRSVLEDVCKRMIEVILFCLPHAKRGTIYTVGPIPELRVVRIASGDKDDETEKASWDLKRRSDYDFPGKTWDDYRDRPEGILEAMAWCVEKQKSWTADDPENNVRSVRKQLEGKAGEDYHHMEPVLVRKTDLWEAMPPTDIYQKDSQRKAIWQNTPYATVAVIKIHFQPGTIKKADRSTKIIKELSQSLGTEMLSLHAREVTLEKEKSLVEERQETCDVLAHEFRNLVPKIGFAYRAINNEIAYLREMWEKMIYEHLPEQSSKHAILQQLEDILRNLEAEYSGQDVINDISVVSRYQQELMESCLLPHQNETWLRQKIRPLWSSILSKTGLKPDMANRVEELLARLGQSFHVGLDEQLKDKIEEIPEELKDRWVDLAYQEINGANNGMIKEYIDLLENLEFNLPRKITSLKNLKYLQALVQLVPDIEEKLNNQLEQLKNSK